MRPSPATISAVATAAYPRFEAYLPEVRIYDGRYVVRFARTARELESVLKLRFEVFNVELGEGLESSFRTGLDLDEFDERCHHLIVTEKDSGAVVGTYRLQTIEMAGDATRFYSATEFELQQLPGEVLANAVELGRACIARSHRNRQVLFLLWRGLAQYLIYNNKRFLFGCCSLTSQDPEEGRRVWDHLAREGHLHPMLVASPKPGFECIGRDSEEEKTTARVPRLFATYLGIGAKVCGPPAIDRVFKTIDFLVLFDIQSMDGRSRQMFFGG